ncbi:MAG: putative toxin-antitoxin system toxin component, PIN family, partial [Acidobacteria bacterium]|nr:putative toxin-antitoxin system toxin component, PIN family [Acidobacteriota bacterium]
VVKSQPHIHVLKDEADNRILECALLAEADLIVTGDRHLLSLRQYRDMSIIALADFMELIQ